MLKPPKPNTSAKAARRLALMKAEAEDRGPLPPPEDAGRQWDDGPDDNEFKPERVVPVLLPALDVAAGDILDPETPEQRAKSASMCAGLDVETFLFQPGRRVPRLVVTGYQAATGQQAIVTGDPNDPTVHARAFLMFTDAIVKAAQATLWVDDSQPGEGALVALGQHPKQLEQARLLIGNLLVNQDISFDFTVIAEDAHQCDVTLGNVGKPDSLHQQVMARVFQMLDLGLVEDPHLRERLIDLAEGTLGKDFNDVTKDGNPRRKKYNLAALTKGYVGVEMDKSAFRYDYYRYLNQPLVAYPHGARKYLVDDVCRALQVASRQTQRAMLHGLPAGERIPNSAEQSKAGFSFALLSAWGIRTDLQKVNKLDADLDSLSRKLLATLKDTGLIRKDGAKAGTRDMVATKALVKKCYEDAGLPVPLTKPKRGKGGGNISTAGGVLEDITLIRLRGSSEDIVEKDGRIDETELMKEPLYAYSQYTSVDKLRNTYLPVLKDGLQFPINASYEIILETGRVSAFQPNLTNLPRGGIKTILQRLQARIREAFVPRPGFVFCSVDFDTLELRTLAQVCLWLLGYSKLGEALNAGIDPHLLLAAEQFLHISYEEAVARKKEKHVADMRQLAKPINFGLPGGLGAATFCEFAKSSYNVYVTEDEARAHKESWFAQWPEMRGYFKRIAAMMKGYDEYGQTVGDIEQFVSGRIRGRTRYTAACNGFFQSLAADGCKTALYEIQKASYLQGGALYGSRAVAFIHDEIIMEHPIELASERAKIQTEIMVKAMQAYTPDIKITASPALMMAWYKGAEEVRAVAGGPIIPWDPSAKYKGGVLVPEAG